MRYADAHTASEGVYGEADDLLTQRVYIGAAGIALPSFKEIMLLLTRWSSGFGVSDRSPLFHLRFRDPLQFRAWLPFVGYFGRPFAHAGVFQRAYGTYSGLRPPPALSLFSRMEPPAIK